MTRKSRVLVIVFGLLLTGVGLARLHPVALANQADADLSTPSYHANALRPPYPATLDPKQFHDALSRNLYTLAARIKPVLYQQPCFCYCDRADGHKSLLDCFRDKHGSECDVCAKEALFAYQQTQKGKTPAQIRMAILRGDWHAVDLQPYQGGAVVR